MTLTLELFLNLYLGTSHESLSLRFILFMHVNTPFFFSYFFYKLISQNILHICKNILTFVFRTMQGQHIEVANVVLLCSCFSCVTVTMDELAESLANSFAVTEEPNSTDAPHPRFSEYKKKVSNADQEARRKNILELQKRLRQHVQCGFCFMHHLIMFLCYVLRNIVLHYF